MTNDSIRGKHKKQSNDKTSRLEQKDTKGGKNENREQIFVTWQHLPSPCTQLGSRRRFLSGDAETLLPLF